MVAACSDWWVKHADARGAGSKSCYVLGQIAARALDSAKTGRLWSLPTVLKVRVACHATSAAALGIHSLVRMPTSLPPGLISSRASQTSTPIRPNQPAHQPFYLRKGKAFDPADPQHRQQARLCAGSSLLGLLHMKALPALEAEAALMQTPRARELDPDLRVEVSRGCGENGGRRDE